MENQIYRVELSNEIFLEFFIASTNDVEAPCVDTKQIGIVIHKELDQEDGSLDEDEIDSLINYLTNCRQHIRSFNERERLKASEAGKNHTKTKV